MKKKKAKVHMTLHESMNHVKVKRLLPPSFDWVQGTWVLNGYVSALLLGYGTHN